MSSDVLSICVVQFSNNRTEYSIWWCFALGRARLPTNIHITFVVSTEYLVVCQKKPSKPKYHLTHSTAFVNAAFGNIPHAHPNRQKPAKTGKNRPHRLCRSWIEEAPKTPKTFKRPKHRRELYGGNWFIINFMFAFTFCNSSNSAKFSRYIVMNIP